MGTFAAAQTAGLTFAPILGGVLGEINWRLAFVLVAVVSVFVLAMIGLSAWVLMRGGGAPARAPRRNG